MWNAHACVHTHKCMYSHTHTHSHIQMYMHTHTHRHVQTHVNTQTRTHTDTHILACLYHMIHINVKYIYVFGCLCLPFDLFVCLFTGLLKVYTYWVIANAFMCALVLCSFVYIWFLAYVVCFCCCCCCQSVCFFRLYVVTIISV